MLQEKKASATSVDQGAVQRDVAAGKHSRSGEGGAPSGGGAASSGGKSAAHGDRMQDWSASALMGAMGLEGGEDAMESREGAASESRHGNSTEGAQLEAMTAAGAAGTLEVQTTLPGKGAGTPETREGGPAQAPAADVAGREMTANSIVAPGGAPAVGAGANDCVPSTASAVIAWTAVDGGATWRADVTSLTLSGRIRINPWPSSPAAMTVPNTPNPVVGGNINNTAGSSNHWQAAIDDMADYDTAGGGAGPNWHSTAASTAHEWAHWNQDYVGDAVTSASGGNWAAVNARIDALTVPKAGHADAAAARVALTPLVDAEIARWRAATIARWNTLIGGTDTPGGGGRGYAAGAAVLATHIAAVRAFKTAQGW
jgi:hypothetical protein